ncbi:MAG TPA: response regulator [Azospirillum sp.]|nr:response regulator [Azospirillum sp.]
MPKTILVVDDESDVEILLRQRFRHAIREGEFRFLFAFNGEEAIEVLRREPGIALMLADINMPDIDGLTLLGRMPEIAPHVHTIIVSAYGDMGNIRTAMNLGAYDFLIKPVDMGDLETTIRRLLAISPAARENAGGGPEGMRKPGVDDTLRQAGTLLDQGPVGVVVADLADRIRYVNHRVTAWTGLPPNQLVGARIASLFAQAIDLDAVVPGTRVDLDVRPGGAAVTLTVGAAEWLGEPARVLWLYDTDHERRKAA